LPHFPNPDANVKLVPASTLSVSELTALFNAAYRGYPVPARLDQPALRRHLTRNDVDLTVSRVAVDGLPAAFALIARRGRAAWVGGMGTVSAARRTGVGERTLTDALMATALTGTTTAWLEVLDENHAARALYEKLGFVTTRQLLVCTLRGPATSRSACRPMQLDEAHAWIVAHRDTREPWQRADESLRHIRAESGRVSAIAAEADGEIIAAVIYAEESASITILQIAGRDPAAAATVLQAVVGAAGAKPTRLVNVAADGTVAAAARNLGAVVDHIQSEMQLALGASSSCG
jgi:GNAT superfamily N-acetyltransferase